MNESVKRPPTRQASEPSSSGAPDKRLMVQKPCVSCVTPYFVPRYFGSQVMLKYQPNEAQKYMRHSDHRLTLLTNRPHGTLECDSSSWAGIFSSELNASSSIPSGGSEVIAADRCGKATTPAFCCKAVVRMSAAVMSVDFSSREDSISVSGAGTACSP